MSTTHVLLMRIIFAIFVVVGTSNAVNLTDGLDGLAIGPTTIAAVTYMIFAYVAGHVKIAEYLQINYVAGCGEVTIFCGALAGAGLGFLWFNAYPAQVFMGDVGALALGASRMQMLAHHVLPQALPGILTGTVIGLGRALGESAPLLLIGMVAFIADVPAALTDPATALPVQIYLWASSPEPAFIEKTAAAVVVLMLFLLVMNLAAIALRNRLHKH